ncbi:MAG: glycosyltransferase family 39 protein [Vampirovibrionales bacterium]|nr:glycosyltransferase family 39 protein [Vampirovibrionales bacterium]
MQQEKLFNQLKQNALLIAITAFVLAALFFVNLGGYGLFDVDEPRYAEAAREMLLRHDWITPYFNQLVRFDKPVLHYWLIATSYTVFGISEWAARLPSALTALGTCLLMGHWVRQETQNVKTGLLAVLASAACIEVIGLARMSVTDMTLTFFLLATWVALFYTIHKSQKFWLLAGVLSGLATLTKGPVGIVLPGLLALISAFWSKRFKATFLTPWFLIGLVCWALVTLPWYWAAYAANGQAFLDALVLHNVTRYGDVVSGHKQIPGFYAIVLLVGFLPWTPYLPAITGWLKKALNAPAESLNLARSAAIWAVGVFVFYAVAKTQLLTYILPVFPSLAVLLTLCLQDQRIWAQPQGFLPKALKIGAWVLPVLLVIPAILLVTMPAKLLPREASTLTGGDPLFILPLGVLITGSAVSAWLMSRLKPNKALVMQACTMAMVAITAVYTVVPKVNAATQGCLQDFLARVGTQPLATYEIQKPSLVFYHPAHRVPHFATDEVPELLLQASKTPAQSLWVITKPRFVGALGSAVASQQDCGRYSLLQVRFLPSK